MAEENSTNQQEARKERRKARDADYYAKNKERIKERARRHYAENKERIKPKTNLRNSLYRAANREKIKRSNAAYRERNREKVRESYRRWVAAHPGAEKKRQSEMYAANKEKVKEKSREWYRSNEEKAKATRKAYYESNPEKFSKTRAKRYALEAKALVGDIEAIESWEKTWRRKKEVECHWCGRRASGKSCHSDHAVPLSRGGPHCLDNLVIACAKCNLSKGAKTPEEFIAFLEAENPGGRFAPPARQQPDRGGAPWLKRPSTWSCPERTANC